MAENFTYFWNEAPFSQWTPAKFTIDDIAYNCTEQWMMAEKSRLFSDNATLKLILEAKQPREQKKLGRTVVGFEIDKWESIAKDIVYKGNYAKFTQNPDMKIVLLSTAGTTLVEASPYDKIWGIGMTDFEAKSCLGGRADWKGKNWLGEVLTKLRDNLIEEAKVTS